MGMITLRLCLKLYLCGSTAAVSVTRKFMKIKWNCSMLKYNFNKPTLLRYFNAQAHCLHFIMIDCH